MTRLFIISIITILLFALVVSDKSKTTNEEKQDSTVNLVLKAPPKIEPQVTNYRFKLRIHEESNWDLKIDSVTENEFDQLKKEPFWRRKINGDSLIARFAKKFSNVIVLTDSCCILKGQDKDLEVCRRRLSDDRGWADYDGIDYDHGFLILMESGYESWSYISFNPITRQHIYTSNEPRFIDNNLIFAAGNYYAEAQFQISDLAEGRYFGFECYNWELTAFYREGTRFFLEFTQNWRPKERKYLILDYK
jgi:hypothetical protein